MPRKRSADRRARETWAAVIRPPSSEQIGATVTGLGSGATNTGTVNGPSHAPGVLTEDALRRALGRTAR
jgi:hypothetical protein